MPESHAVTDISPPAVERSSFGLKSSDLAKYVVSLGSALLVAYYGTKYSIQANTASIETNSASVKESRLQLEKHRDSEYSTIEKRLGTVERTTDRIEFIQTKTLKAIEDLETAVRKSQD